MNQAGLSAGRVITKARVLRKCSEIRISACIYVISRQIDSIQEKINVIQTHKLQMSFVVHHLQYHNNRFEIVN
jgi:hypothetical protein